MFHASQIPEKTRFSGMNNPLEGSWGSLSSCSSGFYWILVGALPSVSPISP